MEEGREENPLGLSDKEWFLEMGFEEREGTKRLGGVDKCLGEEIRGSRVKEEEVLRKCLETMNAVFEENKESLWRRWRRGWLIWQGNRSMTVISLCFALLCFFVFSQHSKNWLWFQQMAAFSSSKLNMRRLRRGFIRGSFLLLGGPLANEKEGAMLAEC